MVDSVQTLTAEGLEGPAGSVGQVRESAARLAAWSHEHGTPVILVGHVTKDGSLAGPRTLEHLVDVVLVLEGDRYGALRLLRGAKNRFGSTEETGVLEMTGEGLRDVPDPARAFLGEGGAESPGVAVAAILEGTRPILVEVQALVASAGIGVPRRALVGVPSDRLALLVAVLARRCGLDISSQDLYVSLVGGATVSEPALDLAVALALASTARDIATGARAPWLAVRCRCSAACARCRVLNGVSGRPPAWDSAQAIVPAGEDAARLGRPSRDPPDRQLGIIAVDSLRQALARSIGSGPVPSG